MKLPCAVVMTVRDLVNSMQPNYPDTYEQLNTYDGLIFIRKFSLCLGIIFFFRNLSADVNINNGKIQLLCLVLGCIILCAGGEAYIMHFIWHCWFLNCSVQRPVWMGGDRSPGAGRLSFFMHLSGPSRVIQFLYAPVPPPPPPVWALKPPSWAFHLLCLSLVNICICTHMLVCTHIMLECTHRSLRGGLLYIKRPMHLWFIWPCREPK
jgi:hypothetical protein